FVFALWSLVAFGRGPEWLDLPTVLLSALASISMAALLLGGQGAVSGWRLTRGLRAAAATLVSWVPVVVAALGVVFEVGSLHLADVVANQGPLPHQWRVSSSPW